MRSDVKKQWLEDLRSDNYLQTINCLVEPGKYVDSYCCLGVLHQISGPACGIDNYQILLMKEYDSLVYLNDEQQKSFKEIADWIEINIPSEKHNTFNPLMHKEYKNE